MLYFGDFYQLSNYPCRSTLEIINYSPSPNELEQLSWVQPDIVVTMMNPGGSQPFSDEDGNVRQVGSIGSEVNLVQTRPDSTQTAIERLMHCKGYRHVRVLNLSDVRQPNSQNLIDLLRSDFSSHDDSVFLSPARQCELRRRLRPRLGIVIAAWSYEDAAALTVRGKAAYDHALNFGCRVLGSGGRFAHPSRYQAAWASDLASKLPNV